MPPVAWWPEIAGRRVPPTGAAQREYWYRYQRCYLDHGVRTFPRGAEALARRREDGGREQIGFPLPQTQQQWEHYTIGWKGCGPRPFQVDPDYGEGYVVGRITAVLLQKQQNRLFIGAASGGIWRRSLSPGASFSPRSDHVQSLSIGCLAADPNNADVLYAGTGEPGRGMWCIDTATVIQPTFVLTTAADEAIPAGQKGKGFAMFSRPPARGTRVTLTSSNAAALRVSDSALFPPGKATAWFGLAAGTVAVPTPVTITATVGRVAKAFQVVVEPRGAR